MASVPRTPSGTCHASGVNVLSNFGQDGYPLHSGNHYRLWFGFAGIIALAMTGLICFVICSAWLRVLQIAGNNKAELSVVGAGGSIIVDNFPINPEPILSRLDDIDLMVGNRLRWWFPPNSQVVAASGFQDNITVNLRAVCWSWIHKFNFLSSRTRSAGSSEPDMESWRSPSVNDLNLEGRHFASLNHNTADIRRTYPSPLFLSELLNSGIEGSFGLLSVQPSFADSLLCGSGGSDHFLPLEYGYSSIDSYSNESKYGYKQYLILVATFLCFIGFAFMCFYSVWKVNRGKDFLLWGFLCFLSLVGISFSFAVFLDVATKTTDFAPNVLQFSK